MYEKRRYSAFQSCKVANFQWWSIRGLTTVDHRVFADANNAVPHKSESKACHVAVVGELRQGRATRHRNVNSVGSAQRFPKQEKARCWLSQQAFSAFCCAATQ